MSENGLLELTKKTLHDIEVDNLYVCVFCGKHFPNHDDRREKHTNWHIRRYVIKPDIKEYWVHPYEYKSKSLY